MTRSHRPMRTPVRCCPLVALMLLGLVVPLGCQSTQTDSVEKSTAVLATEHIEAPLRRLQAQAEMESLDPDTPIDEQIVRLFVPSGFDALTPGSAPYQRAMQPLDEILSAIPARALPARANPTPADRALQAGKLYARARSMSQDGQLDQALEELSSATALDPNSSELFLALANLYLDRGDRLSAIGAFQQAVNLGADSPRALTILAGDAAGAGDLDRAIQLASEVIAINDPAHPMARSISQLILGRALVADGRLLAGASALTMGLESFDVSSRDPRWGTEIIQFHTQHRNLWMRVGDAWTALDVPSRAASAYANASTPDQPTAFPLAARQIASHLRAGQPSIAALLYLEHINTSPSRTASQEREWGATLASIPAIEEILPLAIGELRSSIERAPSDAHALIRIQLATQSTQQRVRTICGMDHGLITPIIAATVIELLDSDETRFASCVEILRSNPNAAQPVAIALVRALDDPYGSIRSHAMSTEFSTRLLVNSAALELGRPDILIDAPRIESVENIAVLASDAQIAALNGRWDRAQSSLDALAAFQSPDAIRAYSHALLVAQQPTLAWETIAGFADFTDASVADLFAASEIAMLLEKFDDARSFLERALELDPGHEETYEQLVLLHAPGSPLADEEEHTRILRQLSATLPRSDLFALLRANEVARNGLLRDAESQIVELAGRSPHRDLGISLLLGIWTALDEGGDTDALDRAELWLRAHIESTPASTPAWVGLARLAMSSMNTHDAITILDEGYARTGSIELARTAEQILESSFKRPEEARERALTRARGLRSIDAYLERAERLAQSPDPALREQAELIIREQLPAQIELLSAQKIRLQRVLFALAGQDDTIAASASWIDLAEYVSRWINPPSFQMVRIRALMLADLHPGSYPELVDATQGVMDALPAGSTREQREGIETMLVQQLLANEERQHAFALLHHLATRSDGLDDRLGIEILRLNAGLGSSASATRSIERLAEDQLLGHMIALADNQLGLPSRNRPAMTDDERKADIAYIIASIAQAFQRDENAVELFELTLSYDDLHPWANNDYGYMLVDRNERLVEAEQMLVHAVSALPESASVLDSLGWARYKLGVLEDEFDAQGNLSREGAITILSQAITLQSGSNESPNATIFDHLGDAYWWVGRFDDAMQAWLDAEQTLRENLQDASTMLNPNQQAIELAGAQLQSVRLKISDAESARAPQVSPIPDWENPIPIRPLLGIDPGK